MFEGKRAAAILLMAGSGTRFKDEMPKQFHMLEDKPVYKHALDALQSYGAFDEIVLVCPPNYKDIGEKGVISGGKTRQESSYLALQSFQIKPDLVLIHDGARPLVSQRIIHENLLTAHKFGAADTCIPSTDTMINAPNKKTITSIPIREHFLRGQTPQTFRYDWILKAHLEALKNCLTNATDDCSLILNLGLPVHIVAGEEQNMKITTEFDLEIAQLLIRKILKV